MSLVLALGPLTQHLPACTSIMVGRKASTDGSVMTSHTCDSHRTTSQVVVVPPAKHEAGTERALTKRCDDDTGPMPRYGRTPTGTIPQVAETFGYLAPAYACMNERQLAIGESTFDGREELLSDKGLIDCETLTRLMLERAATAREAIRIGGELLKQYGWCDVGEALTIADPQEVWVLEIIGPGKDQVGAVWAAQRVPDDHVSVVANAARIGEIDSGQSGLLHGVGQRRSRSPSSMATGTRKAASRFDSTKRTIPTAGPVSRRTRREWRVLDSAGPVPEAAPQQQRVSVFGQAGPTGRSGEDHGAVPRYVRRHRLRHGQGPHGHGRGREDGQEPAGQSVHAVRHEQAVQDQRRLGGTGASGRWPAGTACTPPSRSPGPGCRIRSAASSGSATAIRP